jgi:cystathionine beta-lyase/cystathionine gamma-synthase
MKKRDVHIDTKLIHAGEPSPRIAGAVSMPIFQSANFETPIRTEYDEVRYIRLNNTPNHDVLHAKLAALENAEAALVTSSGMAAITTSLLTVLGRGDHLLVQDVLYGGTHALITTHFQDFGIEYDFIDGTDPASWESKIRPTTKAIYVESISNPMMGVPELAAVPEFAKKHGLVTLIDNTFTSPINFRPAEWGYDLSLHSGTKYLNGHHDTVCGAVIGGADWVTEVRHHLKLFGGSLDPHACFLLHRGLKTLHLRVRYQNDSALDIARFLEGHPAVSSVNYPGLETSPDHARARKALDGFGGMLSFEMAGGLEAADKFMNAVEIPIVAASLGGVDSLVTRPAFTSHSLLSQEDRNRLGITDGLIRMSVGVESPDDIIDDLRRALES